MNENNNPVTNEELAKAFGGDEPESQKEPVEHEPTNNELKQKHKSNGNLLFIIFMILGGVCFAGGLAMLIVALMMSPEIISPIQYPDLTKKETAEVVYSNLTGEVLADASLKNAPAYCIQTPNGTDGARPHAGLNQAGVVFEAIAEAGITRFAAIYQNPTAAIIGPIRSLRIYYLEWDTPFDCTIVHAGGSDDALAAVSRGYKDLTEDYSYMHRGTYSARLWNNLFTTSADLKRFSDDHGYTTSEIKGFTRMTPAESEKTRIDKLAANKLVITQPSTGDTSALNPAVSSIAFRMGGWGDFNINYQYDAGSNKYLRSYESGAAHEVYSCPDGEVASKNPEDACTLTQMAPSVVIAMMVSERRASDNYHEDIDAIGSGTAYVFQNGIAIQGTWRKSSRDEQIQFVDEAGQEIRLAPGQTFITAVPNYGSVAF